MFNNDDDKPQPKVAHAIGQDLSLLSVEDIEARMALLAEEIERLKVDAVKKRASRDAANAFFKS